MPMTTERTLIFQTKFAVRVWLGYGGRWVAEIRLRQRLVDATFALEMVMRWSGWMDLTGFPGLFQKANRSKLPPQLPLPAQEEKPDEDFGLVRCNARGNDEIEAVGTGSEGTWNCVMAHQARLNLGKRKTKEKNPGGERRNKKTNGVRIAIPLEDILQTKGMRLKDAANHLEVSRSTLKRVCRKYGILSWPPSKGNEHICQSRPKETPTVVQEGVQQLNCEILPCEILPFDRALAANVDTNSVVLKARWVDDIIVKIRLPKPWKMAELEQQVKKRLKLESGTYYIRYKDEESELISILCDEDLQEYISSSRPLDTSSIEVFLVPK